jgi:hypothetical protein
MSAIYKSMKCCPVFRDGFPRQSTTYHGFPLYSVFRDGKLAIPRWGFVQRNLKSVMHVIYNWLLNKHICIIILERLFVYQIKSTCNKIKLILLSYWVYKQQINSKTVTIYPDNRDWMIGEINTCIFKYVYLLF